MNSIDDAAVRLCTVNSAAHHHHNYIITITITTKTITTTPPTTTTIILIKIMIITVSRRGKGNASYRTVWSIDAVTRRLASGVKQMSVRWFVCPSSLLTSFLVARSYSLTTLSSHARATRSVSRTYQLEYQVLSIASTYRIIDSTYSIYQQVHTTVFLTFIVPRRLLLPRAYELLTRPDLLVFSIAPINSRINYYYRQHPL